MPSRDDAFLSSVAVLGGYGRLGRRVVEGLLDQTGAAVTLAGRRAAAVAEAVSDLERANRLVGATGYATDGLFLDRQLRGHDAVILCEPLTQETAGSLGRSLIETGGNVVIPGHGDGASLLLDRRDEIAASGGSALLDAGADPGLPGLVAAWLADAESAAEIEVTARYRTPDLGVGGLADLLDTAAAETRIYVDGAWRRPSPFAIRPMSVPVLGRSLCLPMELPELHGVAARPSVKRRRLWHGGINVWIDILTLMWKSGGRTLLSRQKALSLLGAAARQTRRPHGLALRATGKSSLGTARIDLFHPDIYRATAAMSIEAARALPEAGVHYLHRALGAPWHPHALRRRVFTVTLRRT